MSSIYGGSAGGGGGSGAPAFTDVTKVGFREDFIEVWTVAAAISATTEINYPADTNWIAIAIQNATASNPLQDTGTESWTNPGVCAMIAAGSPIVSGNGTVLYKGVQNNSKALGALGNNAPWQLDFVVKINSTTSICMRAGFCFAGPSGPQIDPPGGGFWMRYDTTPGDTKFTFETRSAGTSTTSTTNSINVDTNFHHFRIRSAVAGTIIFSVDGGAETSISTNITTIEQTVFAQIITRSTASRELDLDFFGYSASSNRT